HHRSTFLSLALRGGTLLSVPTLCIRQSRAARVPTHMQYNEAVCPPPRRQSCRMRRGDEVLHRIKDVLLD
ncbi:hypothetical protein CRENBAI_013664, partial [Crenichthys baileyi]